MIGELELTASFFANFSKPVSRVKVKMRTASLMKPKINVYGDESCHLEHDGQTAMVLGAVTVEESELKRVVGEIRRLKRKHGLKANCELKWTKVSAGKVDFYREVINYFFTETSLTFRGLIIPDKRKLDHGRFAQTHDQWYYKMYFEALKVIFDRQHEYRVYLDIKDTLGGAKLPVMREILGQGSKSSSVKRVQLVRSQETLLLQVTDILIGALSYQARGLTTSRAKQTLVKVIEGHLGFPLSLSSPRREKKFNCLVWEAKSDLGAA